MKLKKLSALLLTVVLALTCMASCRTTPNENAFVITYGGKTVNIKTSLYMCFLMEADQTFQSEATAEADENNKEYEDYKDLKYEDKDYDTWTKAEAKRLAGVYAFSEVMYDKMNDELTSEGISYIESSLSLESYWDQYYGEIYEKNGVSYKTFRDYTINAQYKQSVVYNYYVQEVEEEGTTAATTVKGATTTTAKQIDPEIKKLEGSLRPSDDKINTALKKNFCAVNMIDISITDADESSKKEIENSLKDYKKQLEKGTSFEEVYKLYQAKFTSDSTSTDSSSSSYETVLKSANANKVSSNSNEMDENFDEVYKLNDGEIAIVKGDDCYALILKKNILKDKDSDGNSLKDSYITSAIAVLVQDTYEKDIVEKAIGEMKFNENTSAVKYYSADKIDYLEDETTTTASAE